MQAKDAAEITAQQQANWGRYADTYSEVVIRNDSDDLATLQVISAVKKHKYLPAAGKRSPWPFLRMARKVSAAAEDMQSCCYAPQYFVWSVGIKHRLC